MNNFCCVTWSELAPELQQAKEIELNELIQEKGVPKSALASIFRVMDNMLNFCPSCGSNLNPNTQVAAKPAKIRQNAPQEPDPKPVATSGLCRACGGTGRAGGMKNGKIKCITCHGKGRIGVAEGNLNAASAPAIDPSKAAEITELAEASNKVPKDMNKVNGKINLNEDDND